MRMMAGLKRYDTGLVIRSITADTILFYSSLFSLPLTSHASLMPRRPSPFLTPHQRLLPPHHPLRLFRRPSTTQLPPVVWSMSVTTVMMSLPPPLASSPPPSVPPTAVSCPTVVPPPPASTACSYWVVHSSLPSHSSKRPISRTRHIPNFTPLHSWFFVGGQGQQTLG